MTAQLSREIAAIFRKVTNSNIDEEGNSHCVLTPADCVAINSARMLLAGMDSEPVAWWTGPEPTPTGEIESIHDHETGSHSIPLFAGYYSAPPAPVPDCFRNAVSALESLYRNGQKQCWNERYTTDMAYASGVLNACRAAMLQAGNHTEQHLDMVDHSGDDNEKSDCKLPFDQWLSQQNEPIDVDCGCVSTEAFYHWLRVAYEAGNSPVAQDCWCRTCRPVTMSDMRFVVCPECGNKRCPHANDHRNACTGSNEPGQVGSAYPAAPQQEVKNG